MNIGNDDIDLMDDELVEQYGNDTTTQDTATLEPEDGGLDNASLNQPADIETPPSELDSDDFISALLRSRGINDRSKVSFENDEGEIEEVDWDSLDTNTKLNIINNAAANQYDGLSEQEIALLSDIRTKQLTPAEYLQGIGRMSVEQYIQNTQNQNRMYSIDQYSDEELYVMDLISRSEKSITLEEALEALERAKSNEALFKKLMGAIRKEYQSREDEAIQYQRLEQQQNAQEQYNQFANQIEDTILNFNTFADCELNMSNDDMQQLYSFITGFDNAGNSWLAKALNDPQTLVEMAWFALYGEQTIRDLDDYYRKEISKVRKESYEKGKKEASKKDTPTVTYKPKGTPSLQAANSFDDLDDF